MHRKPATPSASKPVSACFTVRAEDRVEANKIEHDAWQLFLRWCHQVPEGTKVELLREGRVCAWLTAAGTRVKASVQSQHAAPPALLA